jgi:hypothetical protein
VPHASPTDRLCLTVITWLHREHPSTAPYPAATSDGSPAIWPFTSLAPIYFFPCAEQRRLLYLPLFFHEFGHLLYACHKREMDDLDEQLQRDIAQVLVRRARRAVWVFGGIEAVLQLAVGHDAGRGSSLTTPLLSAALVAAAAYPAAGTPSPPQVSA